MAYHVLQALQGLEMGGKVQDEGFKLTAQGQKHWAGGSCQRKGLKERRGRADKIEGRLGKCKGKISLYSPSWSRWSSPSLPSARIIEMYLIMDMRPDFNFHGCLKLFF